MKKRRGAQAETTRTAARRSAPVKIKRSTPTRKPRARVAARSVSLPKSTARSAVSVRAAPAMSLRGLYPAIEPYRHGFLRVSELHELYYEESGNPAGKPAIFLHGGPGAGSDRRARQFFDPQHYRIVVFDQRGCGRSRPNASLVEHTTWHLVADLERLRKHLGIERWLVFGGSWGSTLALAYAEANPELVSEFLYGGHLHLRYFPTRCFYAPGPSDKFPDGGEMCR